MMNYEQALHLAVEANRERTEDEIYSSLMKLVYEDIKNLASIGKFEYKCKYLTGIRGINELRKSGFKVNYEDFNSVIKIKWYPRYSV